MLLFIYACIFILNLVAILLTYRFLGNDLGKKEKGIFIIVGIAVMYLLVTLVYWLSTKSVNLGQSMGEGQNLITFAFVPVNSIVILPFLASSYKSLKMGKMENEIFKRRAILLAAILLVVLVIEFFYFKDIQTGILNLVNRS